MSTHTHTILHTNVARIREQVVITGNEITDSWQEAIAVGSADGIRISANRKPTFIAVPFCAALFSPRPKGPFVH